MADETCAVSPSGTVSALASAKPFTFVPAHCTGEDHFCDTVEVSPDPKNKCFVANDNIRRAERESRASRGVPAKTSGPWDKKRAPTYFDRVDAHLHLDARESTVLHTNGFVVSDRQAYSSYAVAFHDVFQQQLPLYVGVDAILNAVFQANQMLLGEIETKRLGPRLVRMLDRMRATLKVAGYGKETTADLDLYLTVAHGLLHGEAKQSDEVAANLVARGNAASELANVELFGRARMIDFTQLTPRGHYATSTFSGFDVKNEHFSLEQYFRAMMWLTRLELNLVSRDSRSSEPGDTPNPEETPREARDALALADLARRAGVEGDLKAFDDVYRVFAGGREDVSIPDLLAMNIAPGRADAPTALKAAIGNRFKRTARIHYMPEGAKELPAIATMFGPRIVPDIAPLTRLVHDRLPDRYTLDAGDLAYVLGHDRAKKYVAPHPGHEAALDSALVTARSELAAGATRGNDVYSAWVKAVTKIAETPPGSHPSYTKTDAFADFRIGSALAGYAQIRHTFVLLAGQGYDSYGCEIPDGWVEPAVGVYESLLGWSRAARSVTPGQDKFFRRFDAVMEQLVAISKTELAGQSLTEPQRRWLGMVAEHLPLGGLGGDSGEPPKYTGWYFDLFPDREKGAERAVDLVADYFTLTNADQVRYVGVDKVALGVFVVDVGGEPRAMVGPVASTYEAKTPIAERLDDKAARTFEGKSSRWSASYFVPAEKPPLLRAQLAECKGNWRVRVESDQPLGDVSATLLDHHGDAMTATATAKHTRGAITLAFDGVDKVRPEGMHVRIADGKRVWSSPFFAGVYTWADERRREQTNESFSTFEANAE